MSDPRPEELIYTEELMYSGKVEEALEIVVNFEKKRNITAKEQLWVSLLKGVIHVVKNQYKEGIELGNYSYDLSGKLGMIPESIEALILKAYILFHGNPNESLIHILEAEKLLSLHPDRSSNYLSRLDLGIFSVKPWSYFYRGELTTALELAFKALELAEKNQFKLSIAYLKFMLGMIYTFRFEYKNALDYAMASLDLMREMDFQVGIGLSLWGIGIAYLNKGDFNKALEFCEKSLTFQSISKMIKTNALGSIGSIFLYKGELDLALDYLTRSVQIAEELSHSFLFISNLMYIGTIYVKKDDYDQAMKFFNRSLTLSQKSGNVWYNYNSNFYLFFLNLEKGFNEQASNYLENLKELTNQTHEFTSYYLMAKAMMLKKKRRSRDRAEAEKILKQIVEDEAAWPDIEILSIVALSDFLLEELYESNDLEIIDELTPLIEQLLERAKNQNSYSHFAEGMLLSAKLALIQMNLKETKSLLTEAQKVAEEHGLNLLAQKVSSEHDLLLEKVDEWDRLKKEDAPMADRIELASFDGVINRLQGKQAIDPPELVNEEPILLLIMDNSGATYFNHPFVANWDHSDLFSSFMSAFNTFSDEIFSRSIDRIRIGENTILINPVEPFLTCYVIKGQSYPALQKLTRFTEAIRENSDIWQALNKSVKTSEMLTLDRPSSLKTVIDEIFTQ